jgi:Spy/CpxP family protein refolding chaperone
MAKRALLIVLLASIVAAASDVVAQPQPPRRGKWWQAEDVQRQLGLTAAQVDSLEKIFQEKLQDRIRLRQELDVLQAQWNEALVQGAVDDTEAGKMIDRLERARMNRNKARTLVLLQMYRVLTPEQVAKLRESERLTGPR